MPPCAPITTLRSSSVGQKDSVSGNRRVIFPRQMFPRLQAIAEPSCSIQDAELICTNDTLKPARGLNQGGSPSEESYMEPEVPETGTHEERNHVPLPSDRSANLFRKSVCTATPPRRVNLSQQSSLGRYQQTMSPNLYLEAPIHVLLRVSSEPKTPLVSILRESSFGDQSERSDDAALSTVSSQFLNHVGLFRSHTPMSTPMRRIQSDPSNSRNSRIHFDPRIWIREFERSPEEQAETWYTTQDMNRFKRHALALIVAKDRQTATRLLKENSSKAVYTHAALAEESGQSDLVMALQSDRYRAMVAQQEIRRVLIVDPHDICVRLFERAFTTLFPDVEIVGVKCAEQAIGQLATGKFDIILVEERLQTTFHLQKRQQSGSDLFRSLSSIATKSLWIGVSAYLPKDRAALETSGVDLCWNKPPPKMCAELRNDLLRQLLIKRGHTDFARELFGDAQ